MAPGATASATVGLAICVLARCARRMHPAVLAGATRLAEGGIRRVCGSGGGGGGDGGATSRAIVRLVRHSACHRGGGRVERRRRTSAGARGEGLAVNVVCGRRIAAAAAARRIVVCIFLGVEQVDGKPRCGRTLCPCGRSGPTCALGGGAIALLCGGARASRVGRGSVCRRRRWHGAAGDVRDEPLEHARGGGVRELGGARSAGHGGVG
mmetsp:Transcript_26233/g.67794  ORF Transcript_26233/g.67794 Transcript_26233/m.67794 type:complete len:209 (+) Transcript_26233:1000-1626(+)